MRLARYRITLKHLQIVKKKRLDHQLKLRSSNKALWRTLRAPRQLQPITQRPLRHLALTPRLTFSIKPPLVCPTATSPQSQLYSRVCGTGADIKKLQTLLFLQPTRYAQVPTFVRDIPPQRLLWWVQSVTYALHFYLFLKLRYKGKSYKWFKRVNSIVLRFGHSHSAIQHIPGFLRSRRVGKMKMLFFGTSAGDLRSFLATVIQWRPMNIYNGRGLRLARQLVNRKFGKVSAYR